MNLFRRLAYRLGAVFRKKSLEADMAEEMRAHLELQTEQNLAAGMPPDEARFAAQRQFGGVEQIKENAREQRGLLWLEQGRQDLRYAARRLTKARGFTAAAVAVLALGLGVNAAIFNLVHTLLFAPATYARPEEILRVFSREKANPLKTRDFSYPAYREIRESNSPFSGVLASALMTVGVGENGDIRRAAAAIVSSNYFSVLGVVPARGRSFLPDEEVPGRAIPVAIVSHAFWKKHGFASDLLGSTMTVNRQRLTVVGIMPEGFTGTTALFSTEVWLPLGIYDQVASKFGAAGPTLLSDHASSPLMILGRLKPGLKPADATLACESLEAQLARSFPVEQKGQSLVIEPPSRFASSSNDKSVAAVGLLLLGMAIVVLLVACLNLANMLLARGTARKKEIAVRLALGGSRGRIIRQLLTEGLLLALLGGAAGLVLGVWSSNLLVGSLARMIPLDLVWTAKPQPALFAATFGFCVLGTLMFALGPALKLSRGDVIEHLKSHPGEDVVRRRWRFLPRHPLVSAQIALSLALLTAAVLFVRSAAAAARVETGLKAERVFLVEVDASLSGHDETRVQDVYRRLGERFAALPGVESASVAVDVPLSGIDLEKRVRRPGGPLGEKSAVSAKWSGVGENYFKTAGLPLLRGRAFTAVEATQAESPAVVVVNEVLAKRLWPAGDALGQRLALADDGGTAVDSSSAGGLRLRSGETFEVVGIVPAIRHTLFESKSDPGIYLPFARAFQSHAFFHVKFFSLPAEKETITADSLRRVLAEVDPTLPVISLRTFGQHLEDNIQLWIVRAGALLFAAFGALALGLAAVGIYGVMAFSVARRTREIGIRLALGAQPSAVRQMILRDGAWMLATGLVVGGLLALGIGKVVGNLLYQVGATDAVAFTVAPGVLALAAFLACWLPARRATKINPMAALRAE